MTLIWKLLRPGAALAALLLSSCGFNQAVVSLDYQPGLGQGLRGPKAVGVARFADFRRQDPYYLGIIRSPIGTPMETITTRVPVESIVRNGFCHALSSRRMLEAPKSAPYLISGEVLEFRGEQVVHPSAYARVRVNLVRADDGHILFSRIYEAQREGAAYLPGSGSPVPEVRELLSRVLQNVVDQALDDHGLRTKLNGASSSPQDQY